MPIPLPNLDDRTFDELTAEARALIPSLQPDWTNHNVSDPGITLVELLAWLTEMLLFQVNQVPAANVEKFLKLLNGPGWTRAGDVDMESATRQTVLDLRRRYRAVVAEDYEALALEADPQIRRARCVPNRNLAAADAAQLKAVAPAHVSVVVVPEPPVGVAGPPQPSDELCASLWAFFDGRRTLTTRHHVVGPGYVRINVAADLALHADAPPEEALRAAHEAIEAFLDPLTGGPERSGWPFGRALHASDVYAVLEQVSLVDYVENVRVAGHEVVELDEHELVQLHNTFLAAYDVHGTRHERQASG